MVFDRRPVSPSTNDAQRRSPADRPAAVSGGNTLGAKEWCPLARFTKTLPIPVHLLATPGRMDYVRRIPGSVGALAGQARRAEVHQLGRNNGRRNIFAGKKGGVEVGRTKKGKGTKIMLMVEGEGLPLGVEIASASEAEVNLVEELIDKRTSRRRPKRLIYDKAADSDPLRNRLAKRRIELICPHRKNRQRNKTQDGRKLRRYKRRYKVERSISWLQNFRRLVVRYERYDRLFLGLVQLACMFTILQRF